MNNPILKRVPYRYVEHFIMNANKKDYQNKSYTYVIKYDNKIRLGYSNNIYDRFNTHYKIKGCAQILRLQRFYTGRDDNQNFIERLSKYNENSTIHDAIKETTILKTHDDLISGKYKILDMDK